MNYFFLSKRVNYTKLIFLVLSCNLKLQLIDILTKKELNLISLKLARNIPFLLKPAFIALLLKYNLTELGFYKLVIKKKKNVPGKIKTLINFLKMLNINCD